MQKLNKDFNLIIFTLGDAEKVANLLDSLSRVDDTAHLNFGITLLNYSENNNEQNFSDIKTYITNTFNITCEYIFKPQKNLASAMNYGVEFAKKHHFKKLIFLCEDMIVCEDWLTILTDNNKIYNTQILFGPKYFLWSPQTPNKYTSALETMQNRYDKYTHFQMISDMNALFSMDFFEKNSDFSFNENSDAEDFEGAETRFFCLKQEIQPVFLENLISIKKFELDEISFKKIISYNFRFGKNAHALTTRFIGENIRLFFDNIFSVLFNTATAIFALPFGLGLVIRKCSAIACSCGYICHFFKSKFKKA